MSDSETDISAIVIDNGSYKCKAGFAGDDAPRAVFPAVVGTPKHDPLVVGSRYKDTYVGDEAQVKREILSIRSPTEYPDDPNWDDMEKIWLHVFYNELRVVPEEYHVLLTEKPLNPTRCREKMTEIMFEKCKIPGFSLNIDAALSLIASGRQTGVVFDSGYRASYAVPIYEGHVQTGASKKFNMGGEYITECLCNILHKRGYSFSTTKEKSYVNEMKERLCYTAIEYDSDMATCEQTTEKDKTYELPDGTSVTIRNERFRCVEALFVPDVKQDGKAAQHVLCESVMGCDKEMVKQLFENIVLSGSTTMFPGFKERMINEVSNLAPVTMTVKVIAPPERKLSAWIGGSILASLSPPHGAQWITKQEYQEFGSSIVDRKCRWF